MAVPLRHGDPARSVSGRVPVGKHGQHAGRLSERGLRAERRGRLHHGALHAGRRHPGRAVPAPAVRRRLLRPRERRERLLLLRRGHARYRQQRQPLSRARGGCRVFRAGRFVQDRRRVHGGALRRARQPHLLHPGLLRPGSVLHALHRSDFHQLHHHPAHPRLSGRLHGVLHGRAELSLRRKQRGQRARGVAGVRLGQPDQPGSGHHDQGSQRPGGVPLWFAEQGRELLDGLGARGPRGAVSARRCAGSVPGVRHQAARPVQPRRRREGLQGHRPQRIRLQPFRISHLYRARLRGVSVLPAARLRSGLQPHLHARFGADHAGGGHLRDVSGVGDLRLLSQRPVLQHDVPARAHQHPLHLPV